MPRQSLPLVGLLAALPLLAACGTDTLDVATETSALITAQCDAQTSRAAVDTCFETFRTCKEAAGAVEADCRAALDTCLPEGVPQRARHGGGCHADGGRPEGRPPHGPPGGPGLFGPPPGADGGMRGPGAGRPPHGGPGRGGPRGSVGVDDAAAEACHTTARACVEGGGDRQTCGDAARTCVHDAFAAAFAARCDELTAACAANPLPDCEALTQRCAAGLTEPEAGACEAP